MVMPNHRLAIAYLLEGANEHERRDVNRKEAQQNDRKDGRGEKQSATPSNDFPNDAF